MSLVTIDEALSVCLASAAIVIACVAAIVVAGWPLARRVQVDLFTQLMLSTLVGSLILSVFEAARYVTDMSPATWIVVAVLWCAASLIDMVVRRQDHQSERRIYQSPVFYGIAAWVSLALWGVAIQFQVAVFGMPHSFGDWFEHYHRALLFQQHLPVDTQFLGFYSLAARGPVFNAFAALAMNVGGNTSYWFYQVVATVMNTMLVLPMALLLRDFVGIRERVAVSYAVGFLAVTPSLLVMQEIYPWTKAFTVAFLLGGIVLYGHGLAQDRPWLCAGSFVIYAMGFLAHYFVFPMAVVAFLHFVFVTWRRRWPWRAVVAPIPVAAALVGVWFAFLFMQFGIDGTLRANTTTGDEYLQQLLGDHEEPAPGHILLYNVISSTLPPELVPRSTLLPKRFEPPTTEHVLATRFDVAKDAYVTEEEPAPWSHHLISRQGSILGGLGVVGATTFVVVSILAIRLRLSTRETWSATTTFGMLLLIVGLPINLFAVPWFAPVGAASLNLQIYVLFAAAVALHGLLQVGPPLRYVVIVLFVAESFVSSALLVDLLREAPLFEIAGDSELSIVGEFFAHPDTLRNYLLKKQSRLEMLADAAGQYRWAATALLALAAAVLYFVVAIQFVPRKKKPVRSTA